MDAFDRFRQWAEKPPESPLTIPAELHRAVMDLAPEARRNRAKVNQAARRSEAPRVVGCPARLLSSTRDISEESDAHAHSLPGRAVDDEISLGVLPQRGEHEC